MKTLTKFTLKEYYKYNELLQDADPDMDEIFKLFDCEVGEMSIGLFQKTQSEIFSMKIEQKKIKQIYDLNGKRFKACLSLPKIKAGQFIDFQSYSSTKKLEMILSVFLIPQHRKFFMWYDNKYNEGYDIAEAQEYILNNMLIEDVQSLTDFFFRQSASLQKVTHLYLAKKAIMMKMKWIKRQWRILR